MPYIDLSPHEWRRLDPLPTAWRRRSIQRLFNPGLWPTVGILILLIAGALISTTEQIAGPSPVSSEPKKVPAAKTPLLPKPASQADASQTTAPPGAAAFRWLAPWPMPERGDTASRFLFSHHPTYPVTVTQVVPAPVTVAPVPAAETPSTQPIQLVTNPQAHSGWIIQVGAYPAEQEAKQRLASVKSKASRLLAAADPFTDTVTKGEKTYYRARFAGLDKDQAEAACSYLKRNEVECLTIAGAAPHK